MDEAVLLGGGFALILIGALHLRTLFVDPLRLSRPTRFFMPKRPLGRWILGVEAGILMAGGLGFIVAGLVRLA